MLDSQRSGAGYEGTDEYVPVEADPYEIDKDAPLVALDDNAAAGQILQVRIPQWNAESRLFTAEVSQPGQLVLRLFNYPAWRVEVNGQMVVTTTRAVTGQMLIPVQAGENRVHITFRRTWDRTLGGIVSAVTALLLGTYFALGRRRSGFGLSPRAIQICW
jgi:hypothetical protein